MTTSIGKLSKSFFLKLLVGIIILPFVFWGMGDVFRGGNQNVIASIDSKKISTQEFVDYLRRLNLNKDQIKNLPKTDLIEKILSEYIGKKVMILEIEKLNAKKGETIKFKNVLLLNDNNNTEIGSPSIDGAMVEAKLLENIKDRTILVFHKRRRKHSRKKNGHRQIHSKVQITKILSGGGKVIAEAKVEKKLTKPTQKVEKDKIEDKKAKVKKDIKR